MRVIPGVAVVHGDDGGRCTMVDVVVRWRRDSLQLLLSAFFLDFFPRPAKKWGVNTRKVWSCVHPCTQSLPVAQWLT